MMDFQVFMGLIVLTLTTFVCIVGGTLLLVSSIIFAVAESKNRVAGNDLYVSMFISLLGVAVSICLYTGGRFTYDIIIEILNYI